MLLQRWSGVFVRLMVVVTFIFLFSACAKPSAKTAVIEQPADVKQEAGKQIAVEEKQVAEASPVVEQQTIAEKKEEPGKTLKKKTELQKQHIVRKGDSLWWIAKYKDQYNDPYLWPLIYKANKKMIKNPNLIYPGQKFKIPRTGFSMDDIKKERRQAGAPKLCVPPQDSNLPLN
ncbi:MAG: LysM peptidoglycan-binding domain-containing protein [Deltaproteobacteria bacterium]|nr:LysM peptidoglycan-binding domain-containing protein [Deltaproteobacteria bacterium]